MGDHGEISFEIELDLEYYELLCIYAKAEHMTPHDTAVSLIYQGIVDAMARIHGVGSPEHLQAAKDLGVDIDDKS